MRNRIAIILFVFMLAGSVFGGVYSGGTGEPNDPFIIASANDLNEIGLNDEDWSSYFVMVNDINMADYTATQFNVICGNHAEEGSWYTTFEGVFDGKGHVISNLKIELDREKVGLFGYIGNRGTVKNVSLEAVKVSGESYVGGIAGRNEGVIDNCHVRGNINGISVCGGITGYQGCSSSSNCSFRGQITGTSEIGGIAGRVTGGAGGGAGDNILKCYAMVEITGEQACGGIVGHNTGGNFLMCFSKGTITCLSEAGGFAGVTYDHCGYGGVFRDCYADVTVICSEFAGGFSGTDPGMHGQILNCYCSGKVIYDVNDCDRVGGFIGNDQLYMKQNIANCYFLETAGPDTGSGKSLSEEQMTQQESFAGWDFINVWGIGQGQTYPYLRQYSAADISSDGVVNFADFAILAESWLK